MFNKTNKNSPTLSVPSSESIIPDPWETIAPEPPVPSPFEPDRWLRQEHPLIRAAAVHPAMPSVEMPTGLLPPPSGDRPAIISPVKVLLQNELKLSSQWEAIKGQVGQALTLLYWEMNAQPSVV